MLYIFQGHEIQNVLPIIEKSCILADALEVTRLTQAPCLNIRALKLMKKIGCFCFQRIDFFNFVVSLLLWYRVIDLLYLKGKTFYILDLQVDILTCIHRDLPC